MKQFSALIKREFWENRSFTWVPLTIAAIIMLQTIAILGVTAFKAQPLMHLFEHAEVNIEINGENAPLNLSNLEEYSEKIKFAVRTLFAGMAAFFFLPLLIITFNYFLSALYSERQDRSIMFWKSMPISDAQTVLGKLTAGAIAAPLITLAFVISIQVILMLILTPIIWVYDGSAWDLLWQPANPISFSLSLILCIIMQALWWLPVFSWCLLISAWTKRSPFIFATLPALALGFIELISSTMIFRETSSYVFNILRERLSGGSTYQLIGEIVHKHNSPSIAAEKLADFFSNPSVWYGLIFAAACIAASIYIRRNQNEI